MTDTRPETLFPYVVPRSWVESAGDGALLSWPLSADVYVILVFDQGGAVRNVRPEDLALLGMDENEAFDAASLNLAQAWDAGKLEFGFATLKDGVVIGCARGSWMAPAGGLLLGNFHAALREQFGQEEFAAVAVNQHCLFAFPTDAQTLRSESLQLAIDEEFNGHRKPISRSWLLINGQWPQAYPGAQAF